MEKMLFYPTITSDMIDSCGISVDKYNFTYTYQDKHYGLQQKGTATIKLTDPLDIWKVESEGLTIDKTVRIAYPDMLKGKEGIACKEAELGICIIWTNKKLTQTGIIHPLSDITTPQGRTCKFNYTFDAGRISGDLELSLAVYIKKKAHNLAEDETDLINETGVTVGEIERVVLDFSNIYMEFPIEEFKSETEPLWWVEFSEWEDPKTIDLSLIHI